MIAPAATLPASAEQAGGLQLRSVARDSALALVGLRGGDRLISVDGLAPRDVIDLQFDLPGARTLAVRRGPERLVLHIPPDSGALSADGLVLEEPVPGGIRECNNHCAFCFIRGLPPGLRSSLYVFDDDYRYSFLWGSYLTLTNWTEPDWARVGYQRLSPLNVSVHATDDTVRRRMLNNRRAPAILPQLERLGRLGIRVNAQIVLCSGLNDGVVLARSLDELAALHPTVQSISVVPVGLTRHSRAPMIRRPSREEAAAAVAACELKQAELRPRLGVGLVYPSDELYLLAARDEMPPAAAYDDFPVLSNGVGALRAMLDAWERAVSRLRAGHARSNVLEGPPPRRVAWLSGRLAAPALDQMAQRWQAFAGWRPEVQVVPNSLFGDQVSVSGLLSGHDLVDALRGLDPTLQDVVLPRSTFGFDGNTTIDGISAEEVGAAHPGRVHLASDPTELVRILTGR